DSQAGAPIGPIDDGIGIGSARADCAAPPVPLSGAEGAALGAVGFSSGFCAGRAVAPAPRASWAAARSAPAASVPATGLGALHSRTGPALPALPPPATGEGRVGAAAFGRRLAERASAKGAFLRDSCVGSIGCAPAGIPPSRRTSAG